MLYNFKKKNLYHKIKDHTVKHAKSFNNFAHEHPYSMMASGVLGGGLLGMAHGYLAGRKDERDGIVLEPEIEAKVNEAPFATNGVTGFKRVKKVLTM